MMSFKRKRSIMPKGNKDAVGTPICFADKLKDLLGDYVSILPPGRIMQLSEKQQACVEQLMVLPSSAFGMGSRSMASAEVNAQIAKDIFGEHL